MTYQYESILEQVVKLETNKQTKILTSEQPKRKDIVKENFFDSLSYHNKKYYTMEELWYYGKNYDTIPKTIEFDLLWKNYETMKNRGTIVNYN